LEIHRLTADEDAVRRYVEELWLPYHRELETTVDAHALADDIDVVAEEVEFRLDRLESESHRAWVAVDAEETERSNGERVLADGDGGLSGFVTTDVDEAPTVFDRPDRLIVGDIFVREPYRGTGLAQDLIDRAAERARETGCEKLALDVDVDNERAVAFYDTLGFEPYRREMTVSVDEVEDRSR
jgi:GNAT superfamily N-acetyltransferase